MSASAAAAESQESRHATGGTPASSGTKFGNVTPQAVRHLRLVPAQPGMTGHALEKIIDRWDAQMRAQGLAENTRAIRTSLVRRLSLLTGVDARQASADDVVHFLGQPLAASTRATYTGQLRGWFDWLVTAGHREDHPMTGLKSPRVPRRQPRPMSEGQVRRLLRTPMHARTRTMILLAVYAGLRVSEIAAMRGELVDLDGDRLRVLGKGGTDLMLPLHPVLALEAAKYPRRGWWFPSHTGNRRGRPGLTPILSRSVSDIIGDVLTRAEIHATPHGLRHTHATTLLRHGANMRHVQELMRHSTIATTQLYTGVDDEQLRQALLLLPDWTGEDVG